MLGNTQYAANVIEKSLKADIFRIEAENPYPTNHEELVALAKKEQEENARPKLKANIEDLSQYNTFLFATLIGGEICR